MILAYSLDKIATLNASHIEQQTNFRYLLVNQQRFQSREPHCKSSPLRTRGASRSARDEFNAHMSTNGLPPSPSEITKEEREGRIPACLHSLPIVYFKPALRIARPRPPLLRYYRPSLRVCPVRSCSPCQRLPPFPPFPPSFSAYGDNLLDRHKLLHRVSRDYLMLPLTDATLDISFCKSARPRALRSVGVCSW